VKNWAEYDAGLRRRGSLTLWVTPEVLGGWQAARRTTPGGQSSYSELAIETGMMLRLAFHLALRQTEGLMVSIFGLLGVPLSTPDHSTLSRRARKMESFSKGCILPDGPVHLLIDSTGLKVFGAGEWLQEKAWRKSAAHVEKATLGRGCRHRNDHGLDPDRERCWGSLASGTAAGSDRGDNGQRHSRRRL
jgi:hypothetical protein